MTIATGSQPALAGRFVALLLPALLWSGQAAAQAAPIDIVESMHRALVDVAAIEPAPALSTRVDLLAPVLIEAHDFARMGRVTVRRYWRDWSEAERETFVDAFERLSVATYASRFAGIGPDSFEVLGSEADGDDRRIVRARIHRPDDEPVALRYEFRSDDQGWRIVNVLAEDVSELGQMASAFSAILEAGDLSDLLADIEGRIAEL